ncbi:hypothetical protein LTR94_031578, partial [Friedmanniomyces endolithicus]
MGVDQMVAVPRRRASRRGTAAAAAEQRPSFRQLRDYVYRAWRSPVRPGRIHRDPHPVHARGADGGIRASCARKERMMQLPLTLLGAALLVATPAAAQSIGSDAAACNNGQGPAIRVNVVGLKDRTGRLKLELYPANDDDFLKDDRDLRAEGKFFRRVWADMPASGAVQ